MKKVITLLVAILLAAGAFAQEYLAFKGVPIDDL